MNEKRQRPRHRRKLTVLLGGRVEAISADVSSGGFHAEMPSVFLPGAMVHGTIETRDGTFPFKGQVTWAEAGNAELNVNSHFGVRFTEISETFGSVLPRVRRIPA